MHALLETTGLLILCLERGGAFSLVFGPQPLKSTDVRMKFEYLNNQSLGIRKSLRKGLIAKLTMPVGGLPTFHRALL